VNIRLIVSRTSERSCPRVSEFSAKSYFGYDAAIIVSDSGRLRLVLRLKIDQEERSAVAAGEEFFL